MKNMIAIARTPPGAQEPRGAHLEVNHHAQTCQIASCAALQADSSPNTHLVNSSLGERANPVLSMVFLSFLYIVTI
jgi:hypothetical protein